VAPVFVYRNLRERCWSVRDTATRRLLLDGDGRGPGHQEELTLANCAFHVSEAGRERVRRERRKNVHAGCFGTVVPAHEAPLTGWVAIGYNPYEHEGFVRKDNGDLVTAARFVEFTADGKCRAILD
jgi:hypothetical protein